MVDFKDEWNIEVCMLNPKGGWLSVHRLRLISNSHYRFCNNLEDLMSKCI
jgi:hypothetical protein